jgi:hypothetical protein
MPNIVYLILGKNSCDVDNWIGSNYQERDRSSEYLVRNFAPIKVGVDGFVTLAGGAD